MNRQRQHTILGLNFLQKSKGKSDKITGAYDPEQELWITAEQVQGGGLVSELVDHLPVKGGTYGHLPQAKPGEGPQLGGPGPRTSKDTHYNTNGGRDNAWDTTKD
jgi:hypothetical protein